MTAAGLGDKIDTGVARVAERIARTMTRRDALRRGVLGGITGMAALAVGARPAMAVTCTCGPTYNCAHWGASCTCCGCPSGYVLCKNDGSYCSCSGGHYNSQGYCCEYSSGYWVACNGICCGSGCNGYRLCYDCKASTCQEWCTCLSQEFCCQCATPEEVAKEQARTQALAVA